MHWFKLVETTQMRPGPEGRDLVGLRFKWTTEAEVQQEMIEFTAEVLDLGIARSA